MTTRFLPVHPSYIKSLLLLLCLLVINPSCTWLNPYLYFQGSSGDKTTLPIAVEELIEFAGYCDEAYQRANDENKLYEIRDNEFSYHVKQDSGVTILIFRGTENGRNVLTDIDIRPRHDKSLDVYFHKGFHDAATWLLEDIKRDYELEKTVYLTGHSLGGAIAQIMGYWLDQEGYNVQIYSFGAPKVSTTFFGNEPPHYRVVLDNDPIPYMPPYPFLQSGIAINAATLDWEEGGERNRKPFTEIDGRDHSIREYLNVLKRHGIN